MEYLIVFGFIIGLIWFISWLFRSLGSSFVDLAKSTKWYENAEKLQADIKELKAEVDLVYKEMIKEWHRENPDASLSMEERNRIQAEAYKKVHGFYPSGYAEELDESSKRPASDISNSDYEDVRMAYEATILTEKDKDMCFSEDAKDEIIGNLFKDLHGLYISNSEKRKYRIEFETHE